MLKNDEFFNKIQTLYQQNCIDDLYTLLAFSEAELKDMQFPPGIIKKFEPYLKQQCTFDQLQEIANKFKEYD